MKIEIDGIEYSSLEEAQPHFTNATSIEVQHCYSLTTFDAPMATSVEVRDCSNYKKGE